MTSATWFHWSSAKVFVFELNDRPPLPLPVSRLMRWLTVLNVFTKNRKPFAEKPPPEFAARVWMFVVPLGMRAHIATVNWLLRTIDPTLMKALVPSSATDAGPSTELVEYTAL